MNAKKLTKSEADAHVAASIEVINNTAPKGKRGKAATPVTIAAWAFDAQRYGALGQEMGQAAAQQVQGAVNYWDRARTLYVEAQDNGKAQEALDTMFGCGDKVKGKKAPWYRTYKSLLNAALTLGLTVTNSMGMTALQKAIKAAKEEREENDEEAGEQKAAQLLEMFKKIAQGCLNKGVTKAELAKALKELEA